MSQGYARSVIGANDFTEWNWWMSGRLTLTSGTAVTTSDVTAATTLYYTPYIGDQVSLYDTTLSRWTSWTLSEISIAVPSTTSTMYDVWLYNNSGSLALELLAWTNDTTRATALTTQDNIYVKTGDLTRRYLGSIRTTSVSGQTEDSLDARLVWNYYNRVPRPMIKTESTGSWTYASTTWRSVNNNTANRFEIVVGVIEDKIRIEGNATYTNGAANSWSLIGIGVDVTNANSISAKQNHGNPSIIASSGEILSSIFTWEDFPSSAGYHFYQFVERADSGANTLTSYGDGVSDERTTGIFGEVIA